MAIRADVPPNVIDQAPVALIVTDRAGAIARWTGGAETLLGWTSEQVLGRNVVAIAQRAGSAARLQDALTAAAAGEPWQGELALSGSDGRPVSVHLRVSPLANRNGDRVGIVIAALEARETVPVGNTAAAVGGRIAQARRRAGLTQKELAARVGVTQRSIQGYEAGAVVPYRHLDHLAEILGREAMWILTGDSTPMRGSELDPALRQQLRELVHEELATALMDLRL
jgi:PAS domain S-box-containing protein